MTPLSTRKVTEPHHELVQGLRELADWFEAHPELPAPNLIHVSFGYHYTGPDARGHLECLAAALGDRARQKDTYRKDAVQIEGAFPGGILVYASAKKRALLPDSFVVDPEPEPILPLRTAA